MAKEKNIINIELYDLAITERKDDRCGKVVKVGSLTEDDVISLVVSKRTDLNRATLRASLDMLKEAAVESIAAGNSVTFGLGHFFPEVNGVFIGDNAKWDDKIHRLKVHINPVSELREAIKAVKVNVLGMASTGVVINSITDVSTGEVNTCLTPGGGANISGSKIKVAGEHPTVGIFLIHVDSQTEISVPSNTILTNEPSKVSFIIPPSLLGGDFKLKITTQYSSGSILLKEPRSYLFDYILSTR